MIENTVDIGEFLERKRSNKGKTISEVAQEIESLSETDIRKAESNEELPLSLVEDLLEHYGEILESVFGGNEGIEILAYRKDPQANLPGELRSKVLELSYNFKWMLSQQSE